MNFAQAHNCYVHFHILQCVLLVAANIRKQKFVIRMNCVSSRMQQQHKTFNLKFCISKPKVKIIEDSMYTVCFPQTNQEHKMNTTIESIIYYNVAQTLAGIFKHHSFITTYIQSCFVL